MKSFITILVSVCKGTAIFPSLLHAPLVRAIVHLFLMSILSASIIALAHYKDVNDKIEVASKNLTDNFGALIFDEDGVLTDKQFNKPFAFDLFPGFRVDAFPKSSEIKSSVIYDAVAENGIVYSPTFIFMWARTNNEIVVPAWFCRRKNSDKYFDKSFTRDEFESFLKECRSGKGRFFFNSIASMDYLDMINTQPNKDRKVVFGDLGNSILAQYMFFTFILNMFAVMFNSLWYCLLFIGIFIIMNRRLFGKIPFKAFFTMSIYVGFPAIIVATLFPALDLPYFGYETIYYIGFLSYLFPVLGVVQRSIHTPKKTLV